MPKYRVPIIAEYVWYVEIEAKDKDDAYDKSCEMPIPADAPDHTYRQEPFWDDVEEIIE